MDDTLPPLPELREILARLGARPSASADRAREQEREAIKRLTAEERVQLALRLGRRDRALRAAARGTP